MTLDGSRGDEVLPDGAYQSLVTQTLSALLANGDAGERALISALREADASRPTWTPHLGARRCRHRARCGTASVSLAVQHWLHV